MILFSSDKLSLHGFAQVRKLMHKVLSRDTWHYRKMTDGIREKDKDENSLVKEETNGPTVEEPYRGMIEKP